MEPASGWGQAWALIWTFPTKSLLHILISWPSSGEPDLRHSQILGARVPCGVENLEAVDKIQLCGFVRRWLEVRTQGSRRSVTWRRLSPQLTTFTRDVRPLASRMERSQIRSLRQAGWPKTIAVRWRS
ncbi:uncharacterized protein LOC144306401 [Canis aureus]